MTSANSTTFRNCFWAKTNRDRISSGGMRAQLVEEDLSEAGCAALADTVLYIIIAVAARRRIALGIVARGVD